MQLASGPQEGGNRHSIWPNCWWAAVISWKLWLRPNLVLLWLWQQQWQIMRQIWPPSRSLPDQEFLWWSLILWFSDYPPTTMRHTDNETPSRGILLFTSLNPKKLNKNNYSTCFCGWWHWRRGHPAMTEWSLGHWLRGTCGWFSGPTEEVLPSPTGPPGQQQCPRSEKEKKNNQYIGHTGWLWGNYKIFRHW